MNTSKLKKIYEREATKNATRPITNNKSINNVIDAVYLEKDTTHENEVIGNNLLVTYNHSEDCMIRCLLCGHQKLIAYGTFKKSGNVKNACCVKTNYALYHKPIEENRLNDIKQFLSNNYEEIYDAMLKKSYLGKNESLKLDILQDTFVHLLERDSDYELTINNVIKRFKYIRLQEFEDRKHESFDTLHEGHPMWKHMPDEKIKEDSNNYCEYTDTIIRSIRNIVSLMKEKAKLIIKLKFEESKTSGEIAKIMNISPNYVGMQVAKLLKEIRLELEKQHKDLLVILKLI